MKNALSVGTISRSSSRGRVMSLSFKMDPKDIREVSVPSDSCQVDILIYERRGGSLWQQLHCSQGSQTVLENIQAENRLQPGREVAQIFEERSVMRSKSFYN